MNREIIKTELYDKSSEGFVNRRPLSTSERALRALKTLGIFWGLAVGAVLLPVLHFILVPLFFVLGLVLGTRAWLTTGLIEGGEIKCPNCGHQYVFQTGRDIWPHEARCQSCYCTMVIQLQK